jgi:protein-arginine kinase activator protein McsA
MKMKFENLSEYLKQIKKESLICPNCLRSMPNLKHRRKHGCQWCVPIKNTPFCNGHYGK